MGTANTNMKLVSVILLAAAALCIQALCITAEMGELESMVGDPTDLPENPTKTECTTVARSLPVICKMFGKKSCVAFNSKMSAKCGANAAFNMEDDNEDIGEDDDEEMASSDDEHAMADEDEDDSNDVGESAGLGRRGGGGLMTSGSFVMMSANRAGNDEEELGEEDDEEVEEWDLSNAGKCNEDEEAWVQMDAYDKTKGKCIQYAADTKCGVQCFHQGKAVSEDKEQAICSKICRVPGNSGAQCNVIKTVQPMMEESTELGEGKTMYLTRSKVTQADKKAEADPMACAGIRQN